MHALYKPIFLNSRSSPPTCIAENRKGVFMKITSMQVEKLADVPYTPKLLFLAARVLQENVLLCFEILSLS
ncbi:hypothetical protein ACU8KH_05496 [Lachancea thermotolerans]